MPKFRCMSCDRPLRHPPRCEAGKAQQSPAAFEDLGPAAAFSIMYFLVILVISFVFYTVMTNLDKRDAS